MQHQNAGRASRWWTALAAAALAPPACAQGAGKPGDPRGALALLILVPIVPFVVAALFPTFTRRAERAVRIRFGASFGWGILLAVLAGIVGWILTKGGHPGQVAATIVAGVALLTAFAGLVGVAKVIGDWSLRRWGLTSLGPLSVLLGAPLWLLGAVIPIVGWAAGVVTLIASIGVTACVVLAPHTFDEPGGKAPPSAEALASAIGPPVLPDIPFEDDDIPSPSDP